MTYTKAVPLDDTRVWIPRDATDVTVTVEVNRVTVSFDVPESPISELLARQEDAIPMVVRVV